MYDWLSTVNDKFWLILNYSKVIWDIDTKFSPVVVLISFQLSTKFEGHNLLKKTAMSLGSSKWKWVRRAHFFGHTHDPKRILFRIQSCTKKKFELRIRLGIWASLFFDGRPNVNFFESVSKNWCVRCPSTYQHHHRSIKYQALR